MGSMSQTRLYAALVTGVALGLLGLFWEDLSTPVRAALLAVIGFLAALALRRASTAPPQRDLEPRLDLLESVIADETRRPWNPATLPWVATGASAKPILMVPAADYHLAEIMPLSLELNRRDIPTRIAVGESPWPRTWRGLSWYHDLEVYEMPEPELLLDQVSAAVVMKDTGSLEPFVRRCRELGTPVIGKVEGAQDFWDADTPEERKPYHNLDLVLCQGRFDAEALADRETVIVGSTRLERLWWSPPADATEPLALINLNFVYGVRTADRRLWLDSAVKGCEKADIPYVISVHPAERSKITSDRVTSISASRLLPRATVLISRFSTLPFEAMARGVPFIYHNPHGETVKTFADPMGTFETTTGAEDLHRALLHLEPAGEQGRHRSERFFLSHVDTVRVSRSEERGAAAVVARLAAIS